MKFNTDMNLIPDTPGVYLFYSSNKDTPIYVGKSIHLRQRIKSHIYNAKTDRKSFKILKHLQHIDWIETAGELGALLLESQLVKKHMPVFNRKLRRVKQLTGFMVKEIAGYYQLTIAFYNEHEWLDRPEIFGAFRSKRQAEATLLQLVKRHQLCNKLCNIEKSYGPCFSYQLKKCHGACIQKDSPVEYNQRVLQAIEQFKNASWPYSGSIVIFEQCKINNISAYHKINNWCYLGSYSTYEKVVKHAANHPKYQLNLDEMKIIQSFLNHHPEQCINL